MKPDNWDENVIIPLKIIHEALRKPSGEDQYGNLPTRNGRDSQGIHRCPKGPRDASNWAWICHRPSIAEERWRIIPWCGIWAIRYEPIGWPCQWTIVEVFSTLDEARARLQDY